MAAYRSLFDRSKSSNFVFGTIRQIPLGSPKKIIAGMFPKIHPAPEIPV
jgi:hypothetical protein